MSKHASGTWEGSRRASGLRSRLADHRSQARHPRVQALLRWAEREPDVPAEAGRTLAAALAGVDVEELARDDDDLPIERRAEEPHPLVERRRESFDAPPNVKRPVGGAVGLDAEVRQIGEQAIPLGAEGGVDRVGLGD